MNPNNEDNQLPDPASPQCELSPIPLVSINLPGASPPGKYVINNANMHSVQNHRYQEQKFNTQRGQSEVNSLTNTRNQSCEKTGNVDIVDLLQQRRRSKHLSVDRVLQVQSFDRSSTNDKVESLVSNWNQHKLEKPNLIFSTPGSSGVNNSFSQMASFIGNISQPSIIQEMPEYFDTPTPKKNQFVPVKEEDENLLGPEEYENQLLDEDSRRLDVKNSNQKPATRTQPFARQPKIQSINSEMTDPAKTRSTRQTTKKVSQAQVVQTVLQRPQTSKNVPQLQQQLPQQAKAVRQPQPSQKGNSQAKIKISVNEDKQVRQSQPFTPQNTQVPQIQQLSKKRSQQDIVKLQALQPTDEQQKGVQKLKSKATFQPQLSDSNRQSQHITMDLAKDPSEIISELRQIRQHILNQYTLADQNNVRIKNAHQNSQSLIFSNLDQIISVLELDFNCYEQPS